MHPRHLYLASSQPLSCILDTPILHPRHPYLAASTPLSCSLDAHPCSPSPNFSNDNVLWVPYPVVFWLCCYIDSLTFFFCRYWHHCLQFIRDPHSGLTISFADMKSFKSFASIFKIFFTLFHVDYEEIQFQLQIELINLQWTKDFKCTFLACYILDFYKNNMLSSGRLPNHITHTQQVVSIFGTTYCSEQLFSKLKHIKSYAAFSIVKSSLFRLVSSVNFFIYPWYYIFFWLQTTYDCYLRNSSGSWGVVYLFLFFCYFVSFLFLFLFFVMFSVF